MMPSPCWTQTSSGSDTPCGLSEFGEAGGPLARAAARMWMRDLVAGNFMISQTLSPPLPRDYTLWRFFLRF